MTERVLVRAYCNRERGGHTLAKIVATSEGLAIEWREPVYSKRGIEPNTVRELLDERALRPAYCGPCGREFVLLNSVLEPAAAEVSKRGSGTDPLGLFIAPRGVADQDE